VVPPASATKKRPRAATASAASLAMTSATAAASDSVSGRTVTSDVKGASGAPPAATFAREERHRRLRTPRARLVVRMVRRRVVAPRLEDRRHVLPRGLHLVAPREERGVAVDRVEEKPLVRLGRGRAEELLVLEVHLHGLDLHRLAGHLRSEAKRDALV